MCENDHASFSGSFLLLSLVIAIAVMHNEMMITLGMIPIRSERNVRQVCTWGYSVLTDYSITKKGRSKVKSVSHQLSWVYMKYVLIAPNSGAPGNSNRTDGSAKRAVKVSPSKSVPDSINPRRMISVSQVRTKIKNVEVQLTTTEKTAANRTSGGRRAINSSFYIRS
jgi:hypothetical protein